MTLWLRMASWFMLLLIFCGALHVAFAFIGWYLINGEGMQPEGIMWLDILAPTPQAALKQAAIGLIAIAVSLVGRMLIRKKAARSMVWR